jgi:ElaB/YqjD/DUF883 family membrane-anchored ribosome-binding protein/uncharacterized protein Veg
MKNFLLLLLLTAFSVVQTVHGQKTNTPPNKQQDQQVQQQQQKKPPPYVFKTDYDVKMKEVDTKVNNAVGTALTLKRELGGKLDKVDELDNKMQQVEEILNSANFKISLTSDSLKKTRFSVDEIKAETDKKIGELNAASGKQQNLIWGAMALALLLSLGLVVLMNSKLRKLRNTIHRQSEEFSDRLTTELDKQSKATGEELVQFKMRIQDDINRVRTEIRSNNEATTAQLNAIIERLDAPKEV